MVAALVSAGKIALSASEKSEPLKMISGENGKMLYPPKQCPECKKLFTPNKEGQEYCKECNFLV
jgi:hypothetical protein